MNTPWPNTFPYLSHRYARPFEASGLARLSWTEHAAWADTLLRSLRRSPDCESSASTETQPRWRLRLSFCDDTESVPLSATADSAIGLSILPRWDWDAQKVCF